LCIKLVNYRDKYTEMHGQKNVIYIYIYIYIYMYKLCYTLYNVLSETEKKKHTTKWSFRLTYIHF